MNKSHLQTFFLISSVTLLACDGTPTPTSMPPGSRDTSIADDAAEGRPDGNMFSDPELVLPGATSADLTGSLFYATYAGGADDGSHQRLGANLCDHAAVGGTTLIVEVVAPIDHFTAGVPDCDRNYAQPASGFPVRVLANAAGEPFPAKADTVFVYMPWFADSPAPGDRALVTLREESGEWFWLAWVPLKVAAGIDDLTPEFRRDIAETDLPDDFVDLSAALIERNTNYSRYCPTPKIDQQYPWPAVIRDPAYWFESCRDGFVPQDSGEPYPPRDGGG